MTDARTAAPGRIGRLLKLGTIVAVVVGGGLGLAAATQDWYTVRLAAKAAHPAPVVVSGTDAAPALTALALAALALALALAIAGRLARVIVALLGVVVGVCLVLSAAGDPSGSTGVRDAISQATGISGAESVHALIRDVAATAWPALALAGGVIVALGSIAALVTGRLWPGGSRRYDAVRFQPPQGEASARARDVRPGDAAVDDWDELTRGQDPTR